MIRYGKTSQNAISVMSFLAQNYGGGKNVSRSAEIAEARQMPQTLVAKILTILSQANLIAGTPGPHGGYRLARSPKTISLLDIVSQFESTESIIRCPFGENWCGVGDPCPLHHQLADLSERFQRFLEETHLDVFEASEPVYAAEELAKAAKKSARYKKT